MPGLLFRLEQVSGRCRTLTVPFNATPFDAPAASSGSKRLPSPQDRRRAPRRRDRPIGKRGLPARLLDRERGRARRDDLAVQMPRQPADAPELKGPSEGRGHRQEGAAVPELHRPRRGEQFRLGPVAGAQGGQLRRHAALLPPRRGLPSTFFNGLPPRPRDLRRVHARGHAHRGARGPAHVRGRRPASTTRTPAPGATSPATTS